MTWHDADGGPGSPGLAAGGAVREGSLSLVAPPPPDFGYALQVNDR